MSGSSALSEKIFFDCLEAPAAEETTGLCIYLQPQVCLATGETIGAEALVRFKTSDGRVAAPAEFLPMVDRLERHDDLLQAVLWNTGKALHLVGPLPKDFRVAINVDASSVNWHLPRHLRRYLNSACLPPEALAIELTETTILKDIDASISVLSAVRDLGIAVYIDDFGTGYSCLGCLRKLPVNGVKIPREFVRNCNQDKDLKILVSLCDMLSHLNLRTIAEGVETEKQRSLLDVIGCFSAQGYHFSRPVPPAEFAKFL
jgi:EAL domain-containing protein (putative c-di-GMP-specific phosphodiesterase class I)